MPYSQAIIGCILQDHRQLDVVLEKVKPEMLTAQRDRVILSAMIQLSNGGRIIDLVTTAELTRKQIENAPLYLTQCIDAAAIPSRAREYAELQYDHFRKERLKEWHIASDKLFTSGSNTETILRELNTGLVEFEDYFTETKRADPSAAIAAEDYLRWVRDVKNGTIQIHRPHSVLLREMVPFYHGGLYLVLAGYSTVGKTTAAFNGIALPEAEAGANVVVFSNEMSREDYVQRAAAYFSGIPYGHILENQLDGKDEREINEAITRFSTLPIKIFERTRRIEDVARIMKRLSYSQKTDIVILDYLQNLCGKNIGKNREEERYEYITRSSKDFFELSREHDFFAVAVSQVPDSQAREGEDGKHDSGFMPVKGSGDVAADADIFMHLMRKTMSDKKGRELIAYVKKNRRFGNRVGLKHFYLNKAFTYYISEEEYRDETAASTTVQPRRRYPAIGDE